MMTPNLYFTQIDTIRNYVKECFPQGLETTADLILEFMSHSDDEKTRDAAACIKSSKKLPEIKLLFDFAIFMLRNNVIPIREQIYDDGVDGLLEYKNHFAEKHRTNDKEKTEELFFNFYNWIMLKLPAKQDMKRWGWIY